MGMASFEQTLVRRLLAGETWAEIKKADGTTGRLSNPDIMDRVNSMVAQKKAEAAAAASKTKPAVSTTPDTSRTPLGTKPSKSVPSDRDLEKIKDKGEQAAAARASGDA